MATKQQLRQEAAAWRKLAEWCVTHGAFLCNATDDWAAGFASYEGRPPFDAPWQRMHDRIYHHAEVGTYSEVLEDFTFYTQPFESNADNHARVMFCLLAAMECEEEARA